MPTSARAQMALSQTYYCDNSVHCRLRPDGRAGKAGTCPRSPKPRRILDCGGTTPLLLHVPRAQNAVEFTLTLQKALSAGSPACAAKRIGAAGRLGPALQSGHLAGRNRVTCGLCHHFVAQGLES